ncbi:hypothetical protein HHL23_20655 [Chryseobacterium sp. RP-3-3]|uniref:Uncharacterized protein n=1 Tax=Chryseobacterium antibioticum TaxID=2728847 RepID=A0A7Y0FU58_9FLAO|nr:hypothetical protein [Chryseobacterium antibioticum]NML72179.1 hypothetical protein [Chryseobacterium antibioticum]
MADSNGVIGTVNWVPSEGAVPIEGADGADAIATTQTISARNGTTVVTPALVSKTFTLSKKSLVTFSFNVSSFSFE